MKFATFNANSVRARLPIILSWLEREQPDMLCLQETKVQDKDFPFEAFSAVGYEAAFRGQKSYNGVAVITRRAVSHVRYHLYDAGDEDARFMGLQSGHIPVINVYVPQGFAPGTEKFQYKLRWLRDLLSYVKATHDPRQPLLMAGDFNVALEPEDVFDPDGLRGEVGFHPQEQTIMREFLEWGLVDVFRKHCPGGGHYTFWDYRIPNAFKRKMGWRIDYILATEALAEKSEAAWIDTTPRTLEKPSDHTFLAAQFRIHS